MWKRIIDWCHDSETILWARLNIVLALLAGALTYVDPSLLAPVIKTEYLPLFMLANGVATEYLRRRRADDLK